MLLDAGALGGVERARLEQDSVRDADLADVVQEEAPLERRVVDERRPHFERQARRVRGDAP